MTQREKLLAQILSRASDRNISFDALRTVLASLGFRERVRGDHHIFSRDGIAEIANLQPLPNGKAEVVR